MRKVTRPRRMFAYVKFSRYDAERWYRRLLRSLRSRDCSSRDRRLTAVARVAQIGYQAVVKYHARRQRGAA